MTESTAQHAGADAEHWKQQYRELVAEQDQTLRLANQLRVALGDLLAGLGTLVDDDTSLAGAARTLRQRMVQPLAEPQDDGALDEAASLAQQLLTEVSARQSDSDPLAELLAGVVQTLDGTPELDIELDRSAPSRVQAQSLVEQLLGAYQDQHARLAETERFLAEVRGALSNLEGFVDALVADASAGRSAREAFQIDVAAAVGSIEDRVESADDLVDLKQRVREGIAALSERMQAYKAAESSRSSDAEARNAQLRAELSALEAHAKTLEVHLAQQSEQLLRDQLTKVHSRAALDTRIAEELARHQRNGQTLAYTIWDIDHFKRINDTFGHPVGDRMLHDVAQVLERYTRAADFVARLGGEEFVVLLPDTPIDHAVTIANKLRELIAATQFEADGAVVPVTISCGIAVSVEDDTPDALYGRADRALYAAKQAGRNRCIDAAAAHQAA